MTLALTRRGHLPENQGFKMSGIDSVRRRPGGDCLVPTVDRRFQVLLSLLPLRKTMHLLLTFLRHRSLLPPTHHFDRNPPANRFHLGGNHFLRPHDFQFPLPLKTLFRLHPRLIPKLPPPTSTRRWYKESRLRRQELDNRHRGKRKSVISVLKGDSNPRIMRSLLRN